MPLRCSSLPRILSCPAAAVPPAIAFVGDNPAARLGTVVHSAMAAYVQGATFDLESICAANRTALDDARPCVAMAIQLWKAYEGALDVLSAEVPLSGVLGGMEVRGTADIVCGVRSEDPRETIIVPDWKTAPEGKRDYRDQELGYLCLALQNLGQWGMKLPVKCKIATFWVRDRVALIEDVDWAEVEQYHTRVARSTTSPDAFNPTPENCEFCPRREECPARLALVRRMTEELCEGAEKFGALAPADLAALYPRIQMVERICKQYREVLRDALASGPLPVGDGKELRLEPKTCRVVALEDASRVLQGHAGEGVEWWRWALPALSVSLPELKKLVSSQAVRGEKKGAVESFIQELRDAGALRETVTRVTALRKPDAPANNGEEDA